MWVAKSSGRRLIQRRNFKNSYNLALAASTEGETLAPVSIVDAVSDYVIGQQDAKKEVAVALRERWRRVQLPVEKSKEIVPKNMLISGPSGCGKTEIIRRVSKILKAPFVKVDASTFTRSGIVGASVSEIIVDLYDAADTMCKKSYEDATKIVCRAAALDILVACVYNEILAKCSPPPPTPAQPTGKVNLPVPDILKNLARKGDHPEVIVVSSSGQPITSDVDTTTMTVFEKPNEDSKRQGREFHSRLQDIEGYDIEEIFAMEADKAKDLIRKHILKLEACPTKPTLTYPELRQPISSERGSTEDIVIIRAFKSTESTSSLQQLIFGGDAGDGRSLCTGTVFDLLSNIEKRVFSELISYQFAPERNPVKELVENWGIVCIDEIDKVVHKKESRDWVHSDVQKELLTLVEGTRVDVGRVRDERTMSLKMQKSDEHKQIIDTTHILFVCAGAFATCKPTDMMVELLGRLPVRVQINSLSEDDLYKILAKNKYPMIEQQTDLLATEGVFIRME